MLIKQKEVARLLGIDTRTVKLYQALEDDPLPVIKAGIRIADYEDEEVITWYVRYCIGQYKKTLAFTTDDKKKYETREALARAEQREIDVAKSKGELLRAQDVEQEWTNELTNIKRTLLTVPHKLAVSVEDGLSYSEKKEIAQKLIDETLKLLAKGNK